MKYLTKKDLIEILIQYDDDIPIVIEDGSKGHHYGVTDEYIEVINYAYFGNDNGAEEAFSTYNPETDEEIEREFLRIALI